MLTCAFESARCRRRSVKEIARELASEMGNKSVGPVRHAEVEEEKHHAEVCARGCEI